MCAVALALSLTLAAVDTAVAQAGSGTSSGSSEYRELVKEAVREFDAANWAEAFGLFKRAHEIEPNARALRGMGMASYEMRDYVQAIGHLQTAMEDRHRPLTASQREEAERIIARAQNFVARYRIEVEPQRATVLIDGKEVAHGDAHDVVLNSGMREIVVEAEGFEALQRTINAEPGESRQIRLVLAPAAQAAPALAPALVQSPDVDGSIAAAASSDAPKPDYTWVWVSAASSVALAGAGVTFYLLADSEFKDVDAGCNANKCTPDEARRRIAASPGKTYDALAITGFVAAGAAAVASVTLYLIESKGSSEQPSLGVTLMPGRVGLWGRF